jgi:alanine dehydrogenase
MVGAGELAPYLVRAHGALRPSIERVLLWNRTREKAQALAASLAPLPVQCVDALDDAVPQADIVCCATGAREPLIRGALLREGAHLDLVGGFTPEMREADDDALRRSRAFVDCRETTVGVVGDLPASARVEGDLYDLCCGRAAGRRNAHEITFFKSGGGAHLDLMTARFVAERSAPIPQR